MGHRRWSSRRLATGLLAVATCCLGLGGLEAKPVEAAGVLPPADPANAALPDPGWDCSGTGASCVDTDLTDINFARNLEGVTPMVLPVGYATMAVEEQQWVITNLERSARNLPAFPSLDPTANALAQAGANGDTDPALPSAGVLGGGSIWAGAASPLAADVLWMYEDGPGGGNLLCQGGVTSGCWGHRNNILGSYGPTPLMGASNSSAGSYAEVFLAYDGGTPPGQVTFASLHYPFSFPSGMSATDDGGRGYYVVDASGTVEAFGAAPFYGDLSSSPPSSPVVSITATSDGGGYWLLDSAGNVYTFGDAPYYGGGGSMKLNAPVVGMASTSDGHGYWLLARDGGVFTYGDANFFGSTGAMNLNAPVVGIAVAPGGDGYWLVAADGGVFTFTDDGFYGSEGKAHLNRPVIGMAGTPDGRGYTLVASDGGVFTFGDAPFYGSLGSNPPAAGVSSLAASPDNTGYYVLGAGTGDVYAFGPGAPYLGSAT